MTTSQRREARDERQSDGKQRAKLRHAPVYTWSVLPLFDRTGRLPVLLEDALDRGAVLLTANLRAARALEAAYAEDQRSRSRLAWPQPRILDWNSWVAQVWEQYLSRSEDAPMPLSALQERQLWTRVQAADRERVVAPDRLAELAQEAYGLLGSYRAHPLRRAAAGVFAETHADAERFLVWAESFDRTCRQNGWLSRTRLEETLARRADLLDPVAELHLIGFDRVTPAQAALLQALEATGTKVTRSVPEPPAVPPLLQRANDQRGELEACAQWCRTQLAEDSLRRIGVIAPDLGRLRAEIARVFRRVLMPQTTYWPAGPDLPGDPALPYEFSLGTPLAGLPIVRAALLLLRWLTAPLAAAELTWLLTSGLVAPSAADHAALARLDAEMRRAGSTPEVSLGSLLGRPHLTADLRARLARTHAAAERLLGPGHRPLRASHATWSEQVASLLADTGWPGYREADSFTFQTRQRWTSLLGELAELGFDGSQPTWNEYLRTLATHAHSVIFAAESTLQPIQILGAFESSGQSFDALWFLGADDEHWPAAGRPHPLLPAWLQREAGMPHALPETDWKLAEQATARIASSAPVVLLSYAAVDPGSGGTERRASPLLLPYAGRAVPLPAAAIAPPALSLDSVTDDSGHLPWSPAHSAGGAEILKRQAACAFQSFAMRRLETHPLTQPTYGLDAAERGTALHAVLEQLWSAEPAPLRLHTREDLRRALADGSVTAMLTEHIRRVFKPLLAAYPGDPWQQAYLACEQQRVRTRLLAWLGCEAARQPFSVEAIEKKVDPMQIGPLRLAVRIDRVDRLADGTHLLLDYKTGKVKTTAWMGERPEEPQLPLYALYGGVPEVSGVAFAQIRADETRLMARAADAAATVSAQLGPLSEANRLDDEIRDGWQEALLALARQFARGEATVNPRDGAKTCRYCPLAGLCRVHAAGGGSDPNDLEEEASVDG